MGLRNAEKICGYTPSQVAYLRLLPDNQPSDRTNLGIVREIFGERASVTLVGTTLGPMIKRINRKDGFIVTVAPPPGYLAGRIFDNPDGRPFKRWVGETPIPERLLHALNTDGHMPDISQEDKKKQGVKLSEDYDQKLLEARFYEFARLAEDEYLNPETLPIEMAAVRGQIKGIFTNKLMINLLEDSFHSLPQQILQALTFNLNDPETINILTRAYSEKGAEKKVLLWVLSSIWECWKNKDEITRFPFKKDITKMCQSIKIRSNSEIKLSQVLFYIFRHFDNPKQV